LTTKPPPASLSHVALERLEPARATPYDGEP